MTDLTCNALSWAVERGRLSAESKRLSNFNRLKHPFLFMASFSSSEDMIYIGRLKESTFS